MEKTKRTMKKLLSLLLLLPALALAKTPDEEDIIARTMDTASPYYYASLLLRFNNGDETLTDEDYHYLYYGYAYQESYKPLESNPVMDKLLLMASGIDPDNPDPETLRTLLSVAGEARRLDPFSPQILNLMAFAYGALGEEGQQRACYHRMNGIIRAILASGDGFTQHTPRHILMFGHALDVLSAEGLVAGKSRVVSRSVEYVPLAEPYVVEGKKRRGFYFDFSRIYRNKPEGYTYKRERTWQFNNLKPRVYR